MRFDGKKLRFFCVSAQTYVTGGPTIISKEKIISDAYARYVWGDKPESVKEFLLSSGQIGEKEVTELIREFNKSVTGPIRYEGFKSIVVGIILISLLVGFYFVCLYQGVMPVKVFMLLSIVGFYGLVKFTNGLLKLLSPKNEK